MTGFKGTPGPWFLGSAVGATIRARYPHTWANGETVSVQRNVASLSASGRRQADARLIASAPAMLEALEFTVDIIDLFNKWLLDQGIDPRVLMSDEYTAGLAKARAAIALALGEPTHD